MFCFKCGKEVPDNSAFCYLCGADLSAISGVNSNAAQPTQATQLAQPTTKEEWMLAAVKDSIASGLKDPLSARFGAFECIEIDQYGRTYAEIVVHATNSYGAYVPTRYAVGFFDVTDYAPCYVIPNSLFTLPGIMVAAQRKVAKKMMKFGMPR